MAAFCAQREDEVAENLPVFRRARHGPQVIHAAPKASEILTEAHAVATRRTNAVVRVVERQRVTDRRRRPLADCVAQVAPCEQRFTARDTVRIGRVEGILVEADIIIGQAIAQLPLPIFGDGHAQTHLEAGRNLLIGGVSVVIDEIERVIVATEDITAQRDILVEQIGLGETKLDRLRIARIIHRRAQQLPLAAEVALRDRRVDDEAFKAGETGRELKLAGRFFLDIGFEHDAIRRGTLLLLDLQIFLEIAERLDAIRRAAHLEAVEGIAFRQTEFATDDLVLGLRVAVDVDALDIDAVRIGHLEGDRHGLGVLVAVEVRADIGEGVPDQTGGFLDPVDRVFDGLGVIPVVLLDLDQTLDRIRTEITDFAFDVDVAELVAIAFLNHIGDDEIALVRRQFGHRRNHAEIGIAFGQVELAQLLLVIGQTIRVVAVARAEEAVKARLLGRHLTAQVAIRKFLVAENVDLANLRLRAFVDFEDDIDAVLIQLDHFRLNGRGKAALAAVKLDDARDVGTRLGAREDLTRCKTDFRTDLVFLQALIAFQNDAVDHRVLTDLDRQRARIVANLDVCEQLGREQVLQRLIEHFARVRRTSAQRGVRTHRIRLKPLRPDHLDRADHLRLRGLTGKLGNRRRRHLPLSPLRQCA